MIVCRLVFHAIVFPSGDFIVCFVFCFVFFIFWRVLFGGERKEIGGIHNALKGRPSFDDGPPPAVGAQYRPVEPSYTADIVPRSLL